MLSQYTTEFVVIQLGFFFLFLYLIIHGGGGGLNKLQGAKYQLENRAYLRNRLYQAEAWK